MIYGGSKKSYKSKVLISIFVILIVVLIGVLCEKSIAAYLGTSSSGLNSIKAKGRSAVGDTVRASYNDLVNRRDYYCVMYQKQLHGTVTYSVGRYISINGNTATNDVGQSYTSIENGKLAYILSKGEGYGAQHAYTTTQRALYKEINTWYDSVGRRLGISNKWPANNGVSGGDSLIAEATNYAKNVGKDNSSNSGASDKTNKDKITITTYTDNNVEYLRVGPFNWKFSGKLTSVKVYGDKDDVISNVKYSRFEGSIEKFYSSVGEITSGKDFYISIKANSGFTKIGRMVATTQVTGGSSTYSAQIWFLNSANMQNTILVNVGTNTPKPSSLDTTFNYDIPLVKDIEIIKVDSIKPDLKLDNVAFILQNKETGEYLKKSNSTYTFVSKDQATEFKTENGKISIKDVPVATYVAFETKNPNKGYEVPEKGTTIEVGDKTKKITNDYHLGKIKIEKVDQRYTDQKLKDVEFTLIAKNGKYQGKYVGVDEKGNAYYSDSVVYIKTNDSGIIEINDIWEGAYKLTETKNPNYGYLIDEENLDIEVKVKPYETSNLQVKDRSRLGKFAIEKVDMKNHNIKLKEVEFTLKAITGEYAGKYVSIDAEGNAIYSDNEATIKTNQDGKLEIDKVWEGKYVLTEVNNPNYGYIIDENSKVIELNIEGYETWGKTIENEQVYIRLSGFIWIDEHSGKEMKRNDYYKTNTPGDYVDSEDKSFNGIPVKLKRIDTGEIVKEGYKDRKEFTNKDQVTTSEERDLYSEIDGGEYVFEYVRIDELSNYYVEFEYDGLIYQSVVPHLDHNNGSKATDEVERNILDKNFAMINSTGRNEVNVNNGNTDVYNIKYNETVENSTSVKDSSACILHAKTNDAKCNINSYFVPGQTEIRYINLGLYERPQADMALADDLENVRVGVNGYWHVYNYSKRRVSSKESDSWNVGVKFKNSYTGTYKRAVYKEDLYYENDDKSKELQVYLTYKIAFKNEASYITRVNSIVDYFDSRYTLIGAGTGLDKNNNSITGNINVQGVQTHNDKYQKCIIDVNSVVEPYETSSVYVQFKLEREAVLEIVNNRETLYNCAEINSYTVYKDGNGNTVMAVDIDSVPGNAVVGNVETFEDDTESAPPVLLEINDNSRCIEGTVFVDSTSDEIRAGEIRQGDGIFNDGEKTVEGVEVTLHEINNSIPNMVTKTDTNGNFKFEAYIPGQYTITYTWGDKTYTVQYYKGTVYDVSRKQNDMYWYRGSEYGNDTIDVATRKTDAIDNYDTRIKIDNEISAITDNTIYEQIRKAYDGETSGITITKMDSATPTMEFSVEYDTVETDGTIDKVEFIVRNVDFGIVERARQQLDMDKRVKSFKVVLANGQVLADAIIDENGKLSGSHDYVTYMAPTNNNGFGFKGYVRSEIDNELLEGATLEVGYEIKAINNSELDFMTEVYYKYGTTGGNIVTLTPSAVVDYLDKNLAFESDKNPDWKEITVTELNTLNAKRLGEPDVENFLNNRMLLFTDKTAVALKPKETVSVGLNVSKLLTTSKDLTFENDAETVNIDRPKNGVSTMAGVNPEHSGSVIQYFPTDSAEEVQITPSTGGNRDFVVPVIIGVTALVVLSFGVVGIKRKVIDK